MPSIVINEKDETSVGSAAAQTDVAFVPGFSNTNFNYYIFNVSGESPAATLPGTVTAIMPTAKNIHIRPAEGEYPNYACNTVDKITWMYVKKTDSAGQWATLLDEKSVPYIEPAPENTPTFCDSTLVFESYFGSAPFQFTQKDITNGAGSSNGIFKSDVLPKGTENMYSAGDYEKSYIYAKELIQAGIPVVYYNLAERNGDPDFDQGSGKQYFYWQQGTNSTDSAVIPIDMDKDKFLSNYPLLLDFFNSEDKKFTITMGKRTVRTIVNFKFKGDSDVLAAVKAMLKTGGELTDADKGSYVITLTGIPYEKAQGKDNISGLSWKCLHNGTAITLVTKKGPQDMFDNITSTYDFVLGDTVSFEIESGDSVGTYKITNQAITYGSQPKTTGFYWMASKELYSASASSTYPIFTQYIGDYTPATLGLSLVSPLIDYSLVSFYVSLQLTTQKYRKSIPTVKMMYKNLKGIYYPTSAEPTEDDVLACQLLDKGEYQFKYITSGAYPTYETVDEYNACANMISCAHDRGDAVALIDHANNPERSLGVALNTGSVFAKIQATDSGLGKTTDEYLSYASMFTPWATYTCVTAPSAQQVQLMPASFAYLTALASSIVTNANWLAIAGVNRGLPPTIKSLNVISKLSNSIADAYQPRDSRALNAITNIKPYGLTVWGNRTLVSNAKGNLGATSFLNIRNLVSDIKKLAYTTAKGLLYEQDNDILWNSFKISMSSILDKMVTGYGISGYKIIRGSTKYNGDPLGNGEVAAIIKIFPIYAVEDFEITVVMADDVDVN